MSAHNFHAIGNQVVHDKRDGMTIERSHFDVPTAESLLRELTEAIKKAKAGK